MKVVYPLAANVGVDPSTAMDIGVFPRGALAGVHAGDGSGGLWDAT